MTPRELKFRRELSEAVDRLRATTAKLETAKRELEATQQKVSAYMNKNSALWLELSKLPGGLELARALPRG